MTLYKENSNCYYRCEADNGNIVTVDDSKRNLETLWEVQNLAKLIAFSITDRNNQSIWPNNDPYAADPVNQINQQYTLVITLMKITIIIKLQS